MTSYNIGDVSDPCVWCPNGWCIGDPEHEQTQCESSSNLVNQKLPEVISDCMKPADPNVDIEDMYPALQCADVKKYAIGRLLLKKSGYQFYGTIHMNVSGVP